MRQIMGQYRNCLKGRNGEICETGNNKKLNSFTLRECFSYQGEGCIRCAQYFVFMQSEKD